MRALLTSLRRSSVRLRTRDDAEAAEYQKDARDAASLGPLVIFGQGAYQTTFPRGTVPVSMPKPAKHGPTVRRRVRLEVEVDIEIEVHRDRHDGHTGPAGTDVLDPGLVWLASPAAAMKALEEAAYEAGVDCEDLGDAR